MTQTTELAAQLQAVAAQFEKAMLEVQAQTAALQAALANVSTELPVEAVEALAKLQTLAQNFDDLNPDPVLELVVNPEPQNWLSINQLNQLLKFNQKKFNLSNIKF